MSSSTHAVRSWLASWSRNDGGTSALLSPSSPAMNGKLPSHVNGGGSPYLGGGGDAGGSGTGRRDAQPPVLRRRSSTILLVLAIAFFAIATDRRFARRREGYDWQRWLDREVDPSMGSQRSDAASLQQVCDADDELGIDGAGVRVGKVDVGMDRTMSAAQCNAVFPALYKDLDRAVAFFKRRKEGLVKRSDLDEAIGRGHARVLIHNNRMFMKQFNGGPGTRTFAILNSIQEAVVTSPESLPNVEFVIKTLDAPDDDDDGYPLWVLDRRSHQEAFWLMPDFGFYSWPEPGVGGIAEVRDKCGWWEAKQKWDDKIPKLFWRGAALVDLRREFFDIVKGHRWNAVDEIKWDDLGGMLKTPEEHCAYKFLAHAEGYAYSGRLKYLQMCRSVIVAHELEFIQHFHHLIDAEPGSPTQNMVMAPGPGFKGLPQVMQELIADNQRAERIANNSYELFRHYLSPASVNCYWRQMFRSWAKVQDFKPTRKSSDPSFESFNLVHEVHWSPH